jgi:general stress protein YciG
VQKQASGQYHGTIFLFNDLPIWDDRFLNTKIIIMEEQMHEQQRSATNGKSRRGFASMDPARQRMIASEGGRAAHRQGVAHEWNSEEARSAGRKGGQQSKGRRGDAASRS